METEFTAVLNLNANDVLTLVVAPWVPNVFTGGASAADSTWTSRGISLNLKQVSQ